VRLASRPWPVLSIELRSACHLAIGVGIARFAFTPILPLMVDQASMTSTMATACASSNYLGYLVGAIGGLRLTGQGRGTARSIPRTAAVVAGASLAGMTVAEPIVWLLLRFLAGVAGALLFIVAADDLLSGNRRMAAAWGFGGVGAGVAISGAVVLALGASWQSSWWGAAAASGALTALAWREAETPAKQPQPAARGNDGTARSYPFTIVSIIYTLEGLGYIVAGTFLVAAVSDKAPGAIGSHVWIAVGLFAIPSCAAWTWAASRSGPAAVLCIALLAQATGVLMATVGSPFAALSSGALFGATIISVPWLAVGLGRSSGRRDAVALMTVGYSLGQMLGPVVARPLQSNGYESSLIASACVLAAAAALACALTMRVRAPLQRDTAA